MFCFTVLFSFQAFEQLVQAEDSECDKRPPSAPRSGQGRCARCKSGYFSSTRWTTPAGKGSSEPGARGPEGGEGLLSAPEGDKLIRGDWSWLFGSQRG